MPKTNYQHEREFPSIHGSNNFFTLKKQSMRKLNYTLIFASRTINSWTFSFVLHTNYKKKSEGRKNVGEQAFVELKNRTNTQNIITTPHSIIQN